MKIRIALRYVLLVGFLSAGVLMFAGRAFAAMGGGGMGGGGTTGAGMGGGGETDSGSMHEGGGSIVSSLDEIKPEARTFFDQGVVYAKDSKWFLAIAAYKHAVSIEPKFAAAWINLGHSYRKAQQYDNALDASKHAISLVPSSADAHEDLARTYLAMGNKIAAMREYEIVRRLNPKIADELLKAIQANDPDLGKG
jgi:tetratricopeptide (TPR) repeat protein